LSALLIILIIGMRKNKHVYQLSKLYFSFNGQPEIQILSCGCDFKYQEANLEGAHLTPVAKMMDLSG
jgi:hypothetical protein